MDKYYIQTLNSHKERYCPGTSSYVTQSFCDDSDLYNRPRTCNLSSCGAKIRKWIDLAKTDYYFTHGYKRSLSDLKIAKEIVTELEELYPKLKFRLVERTFTDKVIGEDSKSIGKPLTPGKFDKGGRNTPPTSPRPGPPNPQNKIALFI